MTAVAGFDSYADPGDAVTEWLKANSNLRWCGYYLAPAPSQWNRSWMGQRLGLQAAGWGIAPIYVGQQVVAPGSLDPCAATGERDGAAATVLMGAEGFADGSYVFLDLENGPPLPVAMADYARAWAAAVISGGYRPGIYCSHDFAAEMQELVPGARIWAFRVRSTVPHRVSGPFPELDPAGCGYDGGYVWQLAQSCRIVVPSARGGVVEVDLSTSVVADPGAPDGVVN